MPEEVRIRIPLRGDPAASLLEARDRAADRGITIEGDEHAGRIFGAMVSAVYSVTSGGVAVVTVHRKTLIYSWEEIEAALHEFFGAPPSTP